MALTLALITLASVILNAGVLWMLMKQTEEERRTDLALALSSALTAQLEVESGRDEAREAGYRRILSAYQATALDVHELYVADTDMATLASVAGRAPATPDTGMRAALYGNQQFIDVRGPHWGARFVEVTSPVAPRGRATAALRVTMPLKPPAVPGGLAGFTLGYVAVTFALVAAFGFTRFQRSLMQPVSELADGTSRIAGGEFGHMVDLDAARELQALAVALNTMSASLAGYRSRTEEQLARLEAANAELKTAQEALIRSEKLASVGRLAAGLAHEVGNPLSAVLGYVDLISQDLGDPALEADLVARSRKELERIHRIIRELLDFARPGSGKVEAVDVAPALEEALATVSPTPALREVALSVQVDGPLQPVSIERDKLHQVLVNLLLNAGDALRTGGGGRITLSAEPATLDGRPAVAIACRDDGPGFDPVALDRAFEPFFTTKDVGQGTGLGLATCMQVAEAAGGRIEARNHPDGGAVLELVLPVAGDDPGDPPAGADADAG
ncbi:MAG: HAMP domain-containing protein [Alphaproteobacteria bacterium]|nr:HAMP domain-containing protein [Alphaproteobacteria bacterium]